MFKVFRRIYNAKTVVRAGELAMGTYTFRTLCYICPNQRILEYTSYRKRSGIILAEHKKEALTNNASYWCTL